MSKQETVEEVHKLASELKEGDGEADGKSGECQSADASSMEPCGQHLPHIRESNNANFEVGGHSAEKEHIGVLGIGRCFLGWHRNYCPGELRERKGESPTGSGECTAVVTSDSGLQFRLSATRACALLRGRN